MPSLTRNEPIRHLLVLMAILLCLIGLAILQTLENPPPPPRPKKRKKKVARRHKKKTGKTKTLQTTDQKISHLTGLPVELLMLIFQHLAPDEVQPYLDETSFQAYMQARKDLRNACLVSKTLEGVARPYLYQGVVVKDADTMAYLLRTLDENQALGQKIKQLVLEVPGSSKDKTTGSPTLLSSNQALISRRSGRLQTEHQILMSTNASIMTGRKAYLAGFGQILRGLSRNGHGITIAEFSTTCASRSCFEQKTSNPCISA